MKRQNGIRFALARPLYASNIGMVARTMKNFGYGELCLVDPRCEHTSTDGIKYAMKAREILESAVVVKTTGELYRDGELVISTTHQSGKLRPPLVPLPELPAHLKNRSAVTILFGGEGGGLLPEELHDSHLSITIPTVAGKAGSMNLAQSVAVVAYELSRKSDHHSEVDPNLPALEDYLEKKLYQRGFFSRETHLPGSTHLRRMLRRLLPDDRETAFLFALFRHLFDDE